MILDEPEINEDHCKFTAICTRCGRNFVIYHPDQTKDEKELNEIRRFVAKNYYQLYGKCGRCLNDIL